MRDDHVTYCQYAIKFFNFISSTWLMFEIEAVKGRSKMQVKKYSPDASDHSYQKQNVKGVTKYRFDCPCRTDACSV